MTTTPENLGPAEKIIQTLLAFSDHMVHHRPGIVEKDARYNIGCRWSMVTHKEENGQKVVYRVTKTGKKTTKVKAGILRADNKIVSDTGAVIGDYRRSGIFPEVATWFYKQVSEIWKLDAEFAARWASYAYAQEHKDLKVVLAAFMLVQSHKGEPVVEDGKVSFYDDDYRDVGEAMVLSRRTDKKDLGPKLLLRIREVLSIPEIAQINRELGFGTSARKPFYGRWNRAVEKWLRHREDNPKVLEGLVKSGQKDMVKELARHVGYKPSSSKFFEILGWEQEQAEDGRRTIAIGQEMAKESWEGLTEEQVCEKITQDKPDWKRIVGLLPKGVGVTRAVMAAAVQSGALSDKDLIIATPTLEELGMLELPFIKTRWEKATAKATDDMRAANIARNVRSKVVKEALVKAADTALQKIVEEVTRGMRVYVVVDISGSMSTEIEEAKKLMSKFVQAFPLDRLHACVFNTIGRIVDIKAPTAGAVTQAFSKFSGSGGTTHASGVLAFAGHKPKDDEDALFIFVGDEGEDGNFAQAFTQVGIKPMAFGFLKVGGGIQPRCIQRTATMLGIPCFSIDQKMFDDVYAIPRTIRNIVAATPVNTAVRVAAAPPRLMLVEQILKTDLLQKPIWAATPVTAPAVATTA